MNRPRDQCTNSTPYEARDFKKIKGDGNDRPAEALRAVLDALPFG
jgi:hypothetical protein